MRCDAKEICPAGSSKPEEECKALYKRNDDNEVTQVAYIQSSLSYRLLLNVALEWRSVRIYPHYF